MTINTILGGHELIGHDLRVDGLEIFLLAQKELHPSVCCCSKLLTLALSSSPLNQRALGPLKQQNSNFFSTAIKTKVDVLQGPVIVDIMRHFSSSSKYTNYITYNFLASRMSLPFKWWKKSEMQFTGDKPTYPVSSWQHKLLRRPKKELLVGPFCWQWTAYWIIK